MRKLDTTVTINKSPKEVWEYMENPETMSLWLDNFVKYELLSGKLGEVGSKGKHYYNERGGEFVMDEEILEVNKYDYMKMSLTSKPMDMVVENYFESQDDKTTELRAVAEFTRVGLMMKLMMLFMPTKKAQAQHLDQIRKLKELVEKS